MQQRMFPLQEATEKPPQTDVSKESFSYV